MALMLIAGGLFAQADSTNFKLKLNQVDGKATKVESIQTWWTQDSSYVTAPLVYNISPMLQAVAVVTTVTSVTKVDSMGTLTEVANVTSVDDVDKVDSVGTVAVVGTVSELTNGNSYVTDSTQKKYRASYTLTSTGADTVWQDTAYGNFKNIYIGYADTGVTTSAGITDSCIVELYDALLSVWKPVGVINMWNGNHYLYVSPGSGLNAEYKIDHYIVDIFRIRFVNTQVGLGTRTGTVSWSGKADR